MHLIKHLLLEDPLALWIALGIVAVLAGVWWSRTGSRRALACGTAFVIAAVTVGVLAWLVETDREKVVRTLDVMARAAAAGNSETFIERISPQYQNGPFTKEILAAVVRKGLEQVRVADQTPVIVEAEGQAAVTQVYVFTAAPGSRAAIPPGGEAVTWEGQFAPDPDDEWRLRSARALKPVRITPEEAIQYLRAAAAAVGM